MKEVSNITVYNREHEEYSTVPVKKIEAEKYTVQISLPLGNEEEVIYVEPVKGHSCMVENLQADVENGEICAVYGQRCVEKERIFLDKDHSQIMFCMRGEKDAQATIQFDFYLQGEYYLEKLSEFVKDMRQNAVEAVREEAEYYKEEATRKTLQLQEIQGKYSEMKAIAEKEQEKCEELEKKLSELTALYEKEQQEKEELHFKKTELESLIEAIEHTKTWRIRNRLVRMLKRN